MYNNMLFRPKGKVFGGSDYANAKILSLSFEKTDGVFYDGGDCIDEGDWATREAKAAKFTPSPLSRGEGWGEGYEELHTQRRTRATPCPG